MKLISKQILLITLFFNNIYGSYFLKELGTGVAIGGTCKMLQRHIKKNYYDKHSTNKALAIFLGLNLIKTSSQLAYCESISQAGKIMLGLPINLSAGMITWVCLPYLMRYLKQINY